MINNKYQKPALTLIEMITSISIIVLITSIFLANYRTNNQRTDLIMTAQKLVTDIRLAQNNTLGLIKYGEVFPEGGWAVNFDKYNQDRYIIFADLDKPASNDPWREENTDPSYDFGRLNDDEHNVELGARIVNLPQGIVIDKLETNRNSSANLVNINFLPPDPNTFIFDGLNQATEARIILKDLNNEQTKTIFINFLGLIEVVD